MAEFTEDDKAYLDQVKAIFPVEALGKAALATAVSIHRQTKETLEAAVAAKVGALKNQTDPLINRLEKAMSDAENGVEPTNVPDQAEIDAALVV